LKYGADFTEYPEVIDKVRQVPGVTGVSPFILNEVMVSSEQNISGVLVKGIDPRTIGQVSDLPSNIMEGDLKSLLDPSKIPVSPLGPAGPGDTKEMLKDLDDVIRERGEVEKESKGKPSRPTRIEKPAPKEEKPPGAAEKPEVLPAIVVGRELGRSLKVYVGDRVNVVSPLGGDLGPQGPMPKSRPFRIGGIFYSGMYEYDSKFAYIDLAEAQKFFNLKDTATGLELKVKDIDDARKIAKSVLAALDGYPYRTKDWGEMNRNLFSALRLEKLVMAVILAIIVVVACLLILGTLVVLAFEKRKEIAILKSLGAAESNIMKVFILEGSTVGIVGTAIGLAAGFCLCIFVEMVGIRLDPEVYYINRLPVRIDAFQFGVVAAISLVLCFLGTIYPALAASEMSPVEGLRNE
jgi:lipoprotein-releasing system permease protein